MRPTYNNSRTERVLPYILPYSLHSFHEGCFCILLQGLLVLFVCLELMDYLYSSKMDKSMNPYNLRDGEVSSGVSSSV